MLITKRNAAKGLAALAGAAMAGDARQAAAQARGGTLTVMLANEPPMLTSAFNTALPLGSVSTKMLEGLLAYDAQMNPRPSLATSWQASPDGLTYTFRLRPSVKWHDGRDFTSADVAFSAMQVWKTMHPRGRAVFANLTAVETPDALTAVFRLSGPSPVLLSALHAYESQILPRHLYEGTDIATNPANAAPIGTGPFRFREWRRGQFILLERNPDYWDAGKPALDRVIFRIMTDAGARSAAMENGSVDIGFFSPVSLAETERLKRNRNIEVTTRGYEYASPMFFMELNLRNRPLDDVRVRRAMMHALDRRFIIENIFLGYAEPATGPIPVSSPFYTPDVPRYDFNPRLANQMLDEAGYRRGAGGWRFTITHDPVPQGDEHAQTADYVKQAFAQVGINVEVRRQDLASQIRRVSQWEFDMSSNPLFAMFDPALGVTRLFWSGNINQGTPFTNVSGFRNAELDRIVAAQATERDPESRKRLFWRLQQIVMEEVPLLYLLEVKYATIANTRVRNHTTDGAAAFGSFADITVQR
ncbi:ABC transporter substrate-binding protein [Falsiroseomonas oryzae]|uniref:ABC transporter substrate-binding protein n=1 Tax=Falsiroseomonas oryzae TaxID=2766473 RepID=UPI0022EB78B0|nr:ABC transporter substrate-binding protein [Roseomonas sp. MO-31]